MNYNGYIIHYNLMYFLTFLYEFQYIYLKYLYNIFFMCLLERND